MIQGHAEVRWELRTTTGNGDPTASLEFTEESAGREAFDDACRDRRIAGAKLVMLIEVESARHSKTVRR